ncbi:MAG: response regulator [Desulfuromonadaceae bacterium]
MSTRTVLIADDSAAMRAMVVAVVKSLGDHHIVEAASGLDALKFLPHGHIDLILTDKNMPDINGLELLSYLRKNQNYKDIPVFIISSEGSAKDIEKGRQSGADEYVVKPFSPDALKLLISRYLCKSDE